ncbi:hypothetical protein EDEG_02783 [Edhazardia aedis USNM 41457]|uniref:AB hydrolase-1 domain-containing protein n=1 Tax=Edhazardia aedis (strain USNM 41457) TaxID=1003232 RepID=J9DN86_EDHAE|nr:hypothetical protein EDEG_02783 [Edhazardia aedis USNM 41457]|eukprot:EJW02842.1 hypothetical protein EDEG_02783 [Edhazardia aedis USNM 41457]
MDDLISTEYFEGRMFTYGLESLAAFESPETESDIVLIYIPGLGGTLMSDMISEYLYTFCTNKKITFCHPQFRSHPHFGLFTLNDDNEDLQALLQHYNEKKIVLFGYSTGSQNILHYINNTDSLCNLIHCFLQAPVSDKEYENFYYKKDLDETRNSIENKPMDYVFAYRNTVFCKERFLDLYFNEGKDDYFSSDLSDDKFERMNPKNVNISCLVSECDEFAVNDINEKLLKIPNTNIFKMENCGHAIDNIESWKQVQVILEKIIFK